MVMSRGQDERSQLQTVSVLLNTCSGMTNRVLIVDGARWILQGDEQERENRTAGVKALHSMLAATTSGRAKELVIQGFSGRTCLLNPCTVVAQLVTSQLDTVDMTVTFLSSDRRLELKSDPREKQFSSLCTAHFAPILCRFPFLHGSGAGIPGIGILIYS